MSQEKLHEMAHMLSRGKPDMGEGHRALTIEENNKIMENILKEVNQVRDTIFFLAKSEDTKEQKALLSILKSKLESDNIPKSLKETIRSLLILHKNKDKLRGGKKTRRRRKKKKRKTRHLKK